MRKLLSALALCLTFNAFAEHKIQIKQNDFIFSGMSIHRSSFVDEQGREVYFRGFNISGESKLAENHFLPFKTTEDAKLSLSNMKAVTGANVIRLLTSWEGINPEYNTIDYGYLDKLIEQIKVAAKLNIYVMLDFHQDLFARALFNKDSKYTGNGAPDWVIKNLNYDQEYCGWVCVHWSQNLITNTVIRKAYKDFWDNRTITTQQGEIKEQDAFNWQLKKAALYIHEKLSEEENEFVLGIDPFNEPANAGIAADSFDNDFLWPFYMSVAKTLKETPWANKFIFAEPLVFWNTNLPIFVNTGGKHANNATREAIQQYPFVFNAHFYDSYHMVNSVGTVKSGSYLKSFDDIRAEADFLKMPSFVSEFGMYLGGRWASDNSKILQASYQGLESKKSFVQDHINFISPYISATQWHWDMYHDAHQEMMNGVTLKTAGDAWNDENFSVVTNQGESLTIDESILRRAYPRVINGHLLNFYDNSIATDSKGYRLSWASLEFNREKFLQDKDFVLLTWQSFDNDDESVIFIPERYDLNHLLVIKDGELLNQSISPDEPYQIGHTLLTFKKERLSHALKIRQLDKEEKVHFLLLAQVDDAEIDKNALAEHLKQSILIDHINPLHL